MYYVVLVCTTLTLSTLYLVICDTYLLLTMKFQFILSQGTCFIFWWENVLCSLKFSSSSLFSHVPYIILFPFFHCVLIVYLIITIFTTAHLFRICYVWLLNTTNPLPSWYFLVIMVWCILNSCLSRRDLSYLLGIVPWFQHNFITVWPMGNYKLKVSVGLRVALDASLRCRSQMLTQVNPHHALCVVQRAQGMF
jgi:hypothetical protein